MIYILLLTALLQAEPAGAKPMTPEWIPAVLRDWSEHDASFALAKLEQGSPEDIAGRYFDLAQHLYNQDKDVARMIVAARAGIDYCLRTAQDHASKDDKLALALRGKAKAISYNLAANCWPGWRDPGITIGPVERAIGLDAAKLNFRLGTELKRPVEPIAHAHWLVGAQYLAAQQFEQAAREFRASAAKFKEAGKPTEEQMAETYELLTLRLQDAKNTARQKALQAAITALESLGNDDAKFFVAQIRTAEEVFATP